MTIALRIANWIITFLFVGSGLFVLYDLVVLKAAYRCEAPHLYFLLFVSLPLSVAMLIISFFETRKLLRHDWYRDSWKRKAYWIKAAASSVVALAIIALTAVVFINVVLLSSC